MIASNKILTWAPQVAVRDKNMECKQRKTYANRENHTEVITSHQSAKNLWKFCYLNKWLIKRNYSSNNNKKAVKGLEG